MIHHTRLTDVAVFIWAPLNDEWEVCAPALIDLARKLPNGRPLLARLNYDEALAFAELVGGQLISAEQLEHLRKTARWQLIPYLGTPRAENEIQHSERHDGDVWRQLDVLSWDEKSAVMGAGKHWIAGAPPGRSRLMGWDKDGPGPRAVYWQPATVAHNRQHFDDGTTTLIVRRRDRQPHDTEPAPPDTKPMKPTRHTIREGSTGPDVEAWQAIVGVYLDGAFGPLTEAATKKWQRVRGLVDDGVVGEKSWRAAGEKWEPTGLSRSIVSAACKAALRDANLAWPTRRTQSDGTLGDEAHQAKKSDHNTGDAVDITHDPVSGCTGDVIADLAIHDERVQYVIWDRKIWNVDRASEGWRKYTGKNPHTKHVHLSMKTTRGFRNDGRPFPWAPGSEPPPRSA